VSLFRRKVKAEREKTAVEVDPTSDEGIVGIFYSIVWGAEESFENAAKRHLQRIHEPGGYELEKSEHDFMELGMKRSYLDALDDIEFSVEDSFAVPALPARRRGMANVITRWVATGVHNRPLLGIEPTGEQITIGGLTFTTFRNYNIRLEYSYWELPDLTRRATEVAERAAERQ